MKNQTKNIAAAIIISALFFVPVFCSAQVSGTTGDSNRYVYNPTPPGELFYFLEEEEEEEATLETIELMNMLQKQQQTVQMMSNISKVLHDTAMAVIRKTG